MKHFQTDPKLHIIHNQWVVTENTSKFKLCPYLEFSLFISTKLSQICCTMGPGCLDLLDLLRIGLDLDLTMLGIRDSPKFTQDLPRMWRN